MVMMIKSNKPLNLSQFLFSFYSKNMSEPQFSSVRKYGWKRDTSASTEPIRIFSVSRSQQAIPKVDLRPLCPPVYNQGNVGSCTANALAAAYQFDQTKEHFMPSRLFIYYEERVLENTVHADEGAEISSGIKVLKNKGVCPETHATASATASSVDMTWPYIEKKFDVQPNKACYDFASKHTIKSYHRVTQSIPQLRQSLIKGFPVVFGFKVYSSFEGKEVEKTGILKMPKKEEQMCGGHAVLIVGYDDTMEIEGVKGAFIVRNSWGDSWGDKGYFYMPYAYVVDNDLSSDFWSIISL
jgi:C1A family cysteine protease